jgi:hypothetical protein
MLLRMEALGYKTGRVAELVALLVARGIEDYQAEAGKAFRVDDPDARLLYRFHKKEYIGAAHGLSGILQMLILALGRVPNPEEERLWPAIEKSVLFLLELQRPDGNWGSSTSPGSSCLVQFCHGAPGLVIMLCTYLDYCLTRQKMAHVPLALESLLRAEGVLWREGLLRKGFGLCHGISGNGYAYLSLLKLIKKHKPLPLNYE